MKKDVPGAVEKTVEKTVETAETAVRQPVTKKFARLGFYAKGTLFVIVGGLAILLAAGFPEGRISDPTEALGAIARKPFGKFLLIAFAVGAAGHGSWNILRGIADIDNAGGGWLGIPKRVIAAGIGVVYFGLALTAVQIVLATRVAARPGQAEETLVSVLLAVPVLGTALLFVIGVGVIGAGLHECYNGLSGRFRENYRSWEISGLHLFFIKLLGVLSFSARAVILLIIGYYFVAAAVWNSHDGSIGIDAALATLAQNSYGRVLLFAAATGLFAHGILAFYEAKYRRIC